MPGVGRRAAPGHSTRPAPDDQTVEQTASRYVPKRNNAETQAVASRWPRTTANSQQRRWHQRARHDAISLAQGSG